jgi:two-component system, NarL family, response regulator NreC
MGLSVILAEDHVLVRQGVRSLLDREDFAVIGEVSNGQEAARLAAEKHPDIAVLDLGMPMMNGLEAAQEIGRCSPRTKVVMLTRHDDDQYVLSALRAGVRGYVLKSQAVYDLVQAIRQVFRGEVYLSPGVSKAVVDAFLSKSDSAEERLTMRERQVVKLIGEGKTTKEAASFLGISTKTAESHRTRLMQKLDIHSTAELVRYAVRRGLVEA